MVVSKALPPAKFHSNMKNLERWILQMNDYFTITLTCNNVTECHYWIKSCISYNLVKHYHILPYIVRTVARTSLPYHCRNPWGSYLANSQNTCFPTVRTFKKPVSWIYDVIIVQGTRSLLVTCPCSYLGPMGINTCLSPLSWSIDRKQDRDK